MKFKRFLAVFLVLCMSMSMLPAQARAAEEAQTSLDDSNMSIEGTNGFGTLLSNEIIASQAEEEETASDYQAGYSVTDLSFSDSTATAVYDALEEATLVVAVYTEDGLQMLASGKTTVSPEETEATVTIEGTVPEYFYACAYLLDTEDFVPLCEDYTTPMYTREMQELLASTVDDYDAERVYNLDEDKTTNFAVFAEDTIVLREQAGANTVVSADDDARVYVIENADATVTSLTEGDVLAYPYGDGDILIVKVASITLDGTTATITGADLEMNEAFQAVKIEAVTSELSVDPNYQADGITRLDSPAQSRSWDSGIGIEQAFTYAFDVYGHDISSGGAVKITGSLTIGITAAVTVYSTKSYTRVETKLDFSQHYIVTAEGKGAFEADTPFEVFTLSPFVGVTVTVKPKLVLEFSGAITMDYAYTASMGSYINYDGNTWSAHTIRENPKPEFDIRFEGTVFLGISLVPTVELIKGKLARVALEAKLGVELKGTQSLVDWERNPSCLHECNVCVDYDLSIVCSMEPSITLVNNPKLSMKAKLVEIKFKFLDAYWCKDRDEFHLGTCPYLSYRVTMGVLDENNRLLPNMAIRLSDGSVYNTGNAGAVAVYLPNGTYTASLLSSDFTASTSFTVADDSRSVLLSADEAEPELGLPGDVSSETVTDYGAVLGSGTCGSNLSWLVTEGGTLIISGTGAMSNYYMPDIYSDGAPWGRYTFTNVQILEGVTSIGSYAFYSHESLVSVSIPDTVTKIGSYAFNECTSLTSISIPGSVTQIGSYAFYDCTGLTDVFISKGVTTIGSHAFRNCTNLKNLVLPEGLVTIKDSTFSYCYGLTEVVLPDGLVTIEENAFSNCDNLSSVTFPEGLSSIGEHAFSYCRALKEVSVPEGLTNIGDSAFYRCGSLATVNLPKSLVSIGSSAFVDCYSLTNVSLQEGLTSIGDGAFSSCTGITELTLPNTLTSIGEGAFSECSGITTVSIPESLTTIAYGTFFYCYKLKSVTIPGSVNTIEESAFNDCRVLEEIIFLGDAPVFDGMSIFYDVTATVYYPADNTTWTSDVMQDYGGTLTWVPYTPDDGIALSEAAEAVPVTQPASFTDDLVIGEQPADGMTPDAIYGGEYATDVLDTYTLKTASFSGLVPGEEYVMLALVSIETEDILAADNLLGILQGTAGDDGALVFQYVQRVDTDISYVVACGPSNKNLKDATITFPEMTANGELQVANPTVVYGGETLVEGVDYEITGTVDFTAPGEYTCQIRGIRNYTGLVTCTYTVTEVTILLGDVNDDGEIDILDANLVVTYYNELCDLTEEQLLAADVNGDGEVDIMDANVIVAYYNEIIDTLPAAK